MVISMAVLIILNVSILEKYKKINRYKGAYMGIFDLLNNDDKELEQQMNDLDLEDWQKDLVREGKYSPWNFDEDDSSDEDDYYHEDDE